MRNAFNLILFSLLFSQVSSVRGAEKIKYTLPSDSLVTIVVEKEDGTRVRNLVSSAKRNAGANEETWDCLDDNGEAVEKGRYRWRGIVHDELEASYLGSFYSPGTTPWKRHTKPGGWNIHAYGGGGWLSDHEPPWCLFTDSQHVYVGCRMAEAGDAIIQCDLDGTKKWGQMWLGLSGAHAMCTEGDVLYVAGEGFWMGERFAVNRYDIKDYKWVRNPKEVTARHIMHDSAFVRESSMKFHGVIGMYLTTNHIVVAFSDKKRLVFFDRKTALYSHEEPLENAKELSLRPSTKIFRGRATDASGNLYICDTNKTEQCVKVFSPDGRQIRVIGKKGGRKEGRYDHEAMDNPVDVAIDAKGLVWVCEASFSPKRVSVWTREGKLVREYVGTPFYGGGGSLDGRDAYYYGMHFRFDEDFSKAELVSVMFRPEEHPELPCKVEPPSEFRKFRGKKYLVTDDGAVRKECSIMEICGEKLVPRIVYGRESEKTEGKKRGKTIGAFFWQNGKKEVREDLHFGAEWALRTGPGMEIVMMSKDRRKIAIFKPLPGAGLAYDFSSPEFVGVPPELYPVCSLSISPDGKEFVINRGGCGDQGAKENLFAGLSRDGKKILWTYPNPYPSNTHNSPLPKTGELRHTLGIEGFAAAKSGETLMILNGNKGTRYLFTTDGLFVQELFGDMRMGRGSVCNFEKAERGMNFASKSLMDECFGGWMGNVGDKVFLIEGKDSLNVCELVKTETLKRLEGGIVEVDEAPVAIQEKQSQERKPIRPVIAGGFGLTHNWWKLSEYGFDGVKFAVGYMGWNIKLRVEVKDPSPFSNSGDAPHLLFHSGDAVDFRWSTDNTADPKRTKPVRGDVRFVIAPTGEEIAVVKYVFVDPAAKTPPVEFASPVGLEKVARVEKVADAKAEVKRSKDGYVLDVLIPWKEIGETKMPKLEPRYGDIGVIFGDDSGTRAMRRTYYFDKGSQEVSDIPSETRVNPSAWGRIE